MSLCLFMVLIVRLLGCGFSLWSGAMFSQLETNEVLKQFALEMKVELGPGMWLLNWLQELTAVWYFVLVVTGAWCWWQAS